MKTLNFNQGCILGTSELIEYNQQLRDELKWILSGLGSSKLGILMAGNTSIGEITVDNPVGGFNTVKINSSPFLVGNTSYDSYIDPVILSYINNLNGLAGNSRELGEDDLFVFNQEKKLAVSIPGIESLGSGAVRYVVSVPRITVFEVGTCNISTTGQVVFSDANIVKKLRSNITNSPSKLTFFTDSSTKFNSGEIYEVLTIVNQTTIIISGDFATSNSNLYCAIVGSYDIQELPNLVNKYLYTYCRGELMFLTDTGLSLGGTALAKLDFNADHSFVITDLRPTHQFEWATSTPWTEIGNRFISSPAYATYVDTTKPVPLSVEFRQSPSGAIELRGNIWFKSTAVNDEILLDTNLATNRIVSTSKCSSGDNKLLRKGIVEGFFGFVATDDSTLGKVKAANNLGGGMDYFAIRFLTNVTTSTVEPFSFNFTLHSLQ